MNLVEITAPAFDVDIDLKYAGADNFTGKPVYRRAACYLHKDGADSLRKVITLAAQIGMRFKIFDAFRPSEAQWVLWNHTPNPDFLADPNKGSPHSRGVAVDLTLVNSEGLELEMGTGFDEFRPRSYHGAADISQEAQWNRLLLLGLMTAAGWNFYPNEWWHYQLFNAHANYPLLSDEAVPDGMM